MRLLSLLIPLMLFSVVAVAEDARPKQLLLESQGPDGHPPGTHEYVAGQKLLAQSLATSSAESYCRVCIRPETLSWNSCCLDLTSWETFCCAS